MLPSALIAKAKTRTFVAPSGREYEWTRPDPPTQADIDAIVAHENGIVKREKAAKPNPRMDRLIALTQESTQQTGVDVLGGMASFAQEKGYLTRGQAARHLLDTQKKLKPEEREYLTRQLGSLETPDGPAGVQGTAETVFGPESMLLNRLDPLAGAFNAGLKGAGLVGKGIGSTFRQIRKAGEGLTEEGIQAGAKALSDSPTVTAKKPTIRESRTVEPPAGATAAKPQGAAAAPPTTPPTTPPVVARANASEAVQTGLPLDIPVYHGTAVPKSQLRGGMLDTRYAVETRGTLFFTDSEDVASIFRYPREYGEVLYDEKPGALIKARVRMENPLILDGAEAQRFTDDTVYQGQVIAKAKADGHDGVVARDIKEGVGMDVERGTTYAVFDKNQVSIGHKQPKPTTPPTTPKVEGVGAKTAQPVEETPKTPVRGRQGAGKGVSEGGKEPERFTSEHDALETLRKTDPDDPRLNPENPKHDPVFTRRLYRALFGEDAKPDVWSDHPQSVDPTDIERLQETLIDEYQKRDLATLVGPDDAGIVADLRRGLKSFRPEELYSVIRHRTTGRWMRLNQRPSRFYRIDDLTDDPAEAASLLRWVESNYQAGDASYVTPPEWWSHKGADTKLKPRKLDEVIYREQFGVEDVAANGPHKNTVVPGPAVAKYASYLRGRLTAAKKAEKAAKLGISNEELDAALDFYESALRTTGGEDAARGKTAIAEGATQGARGAGNEVEATAPRTPPVEPPPPTPKPGQTTNEIGQGTTAATRNITWRGTTRHIDDRLELATYDALDKETRAAVRKAENEFKSATNAHDKQRAGEMLAIEQRNRSDQLDAYWSDFDQRMSASAREAAHESGALPNLDEQFRNAIHNDAAVASATERLRNVNRTKGGYTRLPVGDLRQIGKDLAIHAAAAIRKGVEYAQWASNAVKEFGAWVKHVAKEAWVKANEFFRVEPKYPGFRQRGSVNPRPRIPVPQRLANKPPPEGVKKGLSYWAQRLLINSEVSAQQATKSLGKTLGRNVEGSTLDLRSALNTQNRIGHKVEDFVFDGIKDEQGNKLSMGVSEIVDGMRKDGFDADAWQGYRRALRENEVGGRTGMPEAARNENNQYIREYAGATDPELLRKWDAEWEKISDAHLKLRERYGLDAPGKADRIAQDNQFYFPMDKVGTASEKSMKAINPQALASPGATVYKAGKAGNYADGFAAMASKIERDVRAGEANRSMLPFFDEASKHEGMAGIAKEVDPPSADPFTDSGDDLFYNLERPLQEGQDAIITLYDKGKARTFEIDPQLWGAIRGMQPREFNAAQKILRAFGSVARGLTTKQNPLFAFVFNPMIDLASAVSQHGMNPLRALQGFGAAALKTKTYKEAVRANAFFESKGVRDFIENQAKFSLENPKKLDKLAASKGIRIVRNVVDFYNEAARAFEEGTRTGFYAQMKKSHLKKGMTEAEAMRRAAQDSADLFNFGEAGEMGQALSAYGTPFSNIWSQAIQSARRGWKRSPVGYTARNLALFTAPALIEYATYKDDPEWQALPDYVKYGGINFRDGAFTGNPHKGKWVSVRIPYEIGVLFKAIPMLAAEHATTDKTAGEQAKKELSLIVDAYTPSFMPTLIAGAMQAVIFDNSGATVDLRFGTMRGYPVKEDAKPESKDKARYKFWKQQADTFLGSLGRLGAQEAGYQFGYEKEHPSPLQRYRPDPDPDEVKKKKKKG